MDSNFIKEKYARLRPDIKQGDLILFRGKRLLAKIIQESDSNAYYNHIGVVGEICGALFIIDSNANGVHPERLSERVEGYSDFTILRSENNSRAINKALTKLLKKHDNVDIKYDFINGAKALFNRWFGLKFKTKKIYNRDICSMFVLPYALDLEMVFPLKDMNDLFFPQDYFRQINKANIIN
jgi:hypothetical protein